MIFTPLFSTPQTSAAFENHRRVMSRYSRYCLSEIRSISWKMRWVGGVNRVLCDVHRDKSCRSLINGMNKLPKRLSAGFSLLWWWWRAATTDYKRFADTLGRKRRWIRNLLDTVWSLQKQQLRDYSVEEWWRGRALRCEFWGGFGASGGSSRREDMLTTFNSKTRTAVHSSRETRLEHNLMINFQGVERWQVMFWPSWNLSKCAHCWPYLLVAINSRFQRPAGSDRESWLEDVSIRLFGNHLTISVLKVMRMDYSVLSLSLLLSANPILISTHELT